jgi:hypothetical protein
MQIHLRGCEVSIQRSAAIETYILPPTLQGINRGGDRRAAKGSIADMSFSIAVAPVRER